MEEQILQYYLNHLNRFFFIFFIILLIFSFYFYYLFNYKNILISDKLIYIEKGENIKSISYKVLNENTTFDKELYVIFLKIWNRFDNINFGEFSISKDKNLYQITKILSKPSNVYQKLTIVDGWQIYQLNKTISDLFNKELNLQYDEILADTYKFQKHNSLKDLILIMKKHKNNFFSKHSQNSLLSQYNINQIITIASLVEKEAIDNEDKKLVSSVILNRLNKKMKLQIDASTIFSITKGKYKFDRKLTLNDLKIEDSYNTYFIKNLPPQPICFVSTKTIEIVLENYKSDYFYYFYDENKLKHIYSKSYEEHRNKLLEYRQKK